ncbi:MULTISPECIES: toxin-antitoxin system HicB family antitoxin [unclassified Dolichospermum]|uniref:toxin-antitoxin system HicB family antitoxin n=1 Tax=unclassified Dolichospermum TaxID=2622029 RepID=UPI0014462D8F|nr:MULTISPECIES: toxin-antitoxin system HicB family antitoxin [unclassified Dolichospermum]MTJ18034.1 toxin-antitoxin system HicB family antitoxin [Dolichospermum sp. UHCC 0299]MTJ37310.1 toxin-antitoxin system HicB family antitoxin [Dolichospermum sp. UHCC 0406]
MSRLTLRLPETLHQHLIKLAETEGVSLNQYIVYALTRQAVSTEFIQATPEKEIIEQKQSFNTLLQGLGKASESEIKSVLAEREVVQPEAELTHEIITSLQQKISNATRV